MKRILQRIITVVVVLAVVIGVGSYFLTNDPDKNKDQTAGVPVVTDADGMTYGAVVNEQGTTYVVVTDGQTNRYMAEYDGVTVGSTVAQINTDVKIEDLPTNYTGPAFSVSQNVSDYAGEVITSNVSSEISSTTVPATSAAQQTPGTTNNQVKDPATVTSQAQQTTQSVITTTPVAPSAPSASTGEQAYRIKKYEEIFKSGTYLMTVKMDDPEYPEPVTVALKNGNMYIETAMSMEEGKEPFKLKLIYTKSSDTMYMLIDDLKKYCKLPEEMVEEFDMSSMVEDFKITTLGEITVSKANINGKDLTVESYINSDGETVNYYFEGDNIVRLDTVSTNGSTSSLYYSLFTTNVPDSYFEVPDDYGYWNLSFLGAFL